MTEEQTAIEKGIRCPDCESQDLPVLYTRRVPGKSIMRVRECQECGKRVRTREEVS